jgi:cell division protein FtsB
LEEKSTDLRRYLSFLVPLLLTMGIIISFSIVIARRHEEWKKVMAKKEVLEKELAQLRKKNLELHKLRDSLLYDPVQIEKEAREQLGYSLPEEVVYKRQDVAVSTPETREDFPRSSKTGGILEEVGLLSFFLAIIAITAGFFSLTYWYEHRRIRQ